MSSELRTVRWSGAEGGGPSEATIERACSLVSDTTNGISSVKVERVALSPELNRLLRAVADKPGVRLVLRPHSGTQEAEVVIEQAISPLHHQPPPSACPGLLAHLRPRFSSSPNPPRPTSRADAEASALRERP